MAYLSCSYGSSGSSRRGGGEGGGGSGGGGGGGGGGGEEEEGKKRGWVVGLSQLCSRFLQLCNMILFPGHMPIILSHQ